MSNLLYDHPGPRARIRNRVLSVLFGLALVAVLWGIYRAFDSTGQWTAAKWDPFIKGGLLPDGRVVNLWTSFILPGLAQTLAAAATAMVLALVLGLILATGRLSERRWIAAPAGAVVEFFRAVPLLLMIFFIFYGVPFLIQGPVPAFVAVVTGLTLYNGSVLAEAFRAGIRAVPKGQSEAAYSMGMIKAQVMQYILVPQAARSMLPVIVSQLVVVLKDTALGYIVAFPELLYKGSEIIANWGNAVPTYMVLAAIYILVNGGLTMLAFMLERRTRRRGITNPATQIAGANAAASGVGGGVGAGAA